MLCNSCQLLSLLLTIETQHDLFPKLWEATQAETDAA